MARGAAAGIGEQPEVDVFAGRIIARLEGRAPRTCGRERPPITTLDLGERDSDTEYAWGTNMAIRRSAIERVGPFDVSLTGGGDEQEWQERMRRRNPGSRIRYVAGAAVEHRRAGEDARCARSRAPLTRAAGRRGASTAAAEPRRRWPARAPRSPAASATSCGAAARRA